ncbi:hypothetical protein [Kineosporia succinea]|uniref:Uncharacterized protein n=1 Tax=Kineosporia succinea TaxID=84632 RepID=A0ABT9P4D8_9ACTN|nr:hypothetical protein [Kineosporia succinea]MDP9827571.1 hypothetical protein [Kineosporia succinea]
MDPKHLVDEALRRFTVMQLAANSGDAAVVEEPAARELVAAFQHLAKLDGWAKVAIDRLVVDPENARATADLKLSMDHAARLHPQFLRTLSQVCAASGTVLAPPAQAPGQVS